MLVIKNKNKFIKGILVIIVGLAIVIGILSFIISSIISIFTKQSEEKKQQEQVQANNISNNQVVQVSSNPNLEILKEWNLQLVNKDNSVDRSYVPELQEIDNGVKFDKRAIAYLKNMLNAMYKNEIKKVWVQSAYRSYDKQEQLFNNKVNYYKNKGKNQKEAEELAQTVVQRPEMSEHNLGLAADFNTVTNEFEKTEAFKWLQKNAQNYGFILRYPKDKQDITGITYESWHWRYVGEEHAKIIKEKGFCLEEYIDYLKETQVV